MIDAVLNALAATLLIGLGHLAVVDRKNGRRMEMKEIRVERMQLEVGRDFQDFFFQTNDGWCRAKGRTVLLRADDYLIDFHLAYFRDERTGASEMSLFFAEYGIVIGTEKMDLSGCKHQIEDRIHTFVTESIAKTLIACEFRVDLIHSVNREITEEFVAKYGEKPEL